jgi:hypothetical protein
MMEQMVNKAKSDSSQETLEKNIDTLKHSSETMQKYVELVEEERLKTLTGDPGI